MRTRYFVAALERRAAEIGRREMALLQHGAHGAVEHQDTFGDQVLQVSRRISLSLI